MADAESQPLLQNDTTTGYQGGQVDIVEGIFLNTFWQAEIFLCFFPSSPIGVQKQRKVALCDACRIEMYASFLLKYKWVIQTLID